MRHLKYPSILGVSLYESSSILLVTGSYKEEYLYKSLHIHTQYPTPLVLINHEENQKCPIIKQRKLPKRQAVFLLLSLFKNMKPAAKSSVMCYIFRKQPW